LEDVKKSGLGSRLANLGVLMFCYQRLRNQWAIEEPTDSNQTAA